MANFEQLLIPAGADREKLVALDAEESAIRDRQLKRGKLRLSWRKMNKSVSASESYQIMTIDGHREWADLNRVSRIHEEKERIIKRYVK